MNGSNNHIYMLTLDHASLIEGQNVAQILPRPQKAKEPRYSKPPIAFSLQESIHPLSCFIVKGVVMCVCL
jgi:hypothetical protein